MPSRPERTANEKTRVGRARAAERMRRSRERRKGGLRCYTLEIRDAEITALVCRGLLASKDRANRAAVIKAMYAFLDRTL